MRDGCFLSELIAFMAVDATRITRPQSSGERVKESRAHTLKLELKKKLDSG